MVDPKTMRYWAPDGSFTRDIAERSFAASLERTQELPSADARCSICSSKVIHAARPDDLATVRDLFREYADTLGVDLSFQDFGSEIADPLGFYEVVLLAEV